jgi:Uma2 family endonuclease
MAEPATQIPTLPDADAFREWAWRQPEKWEFIDGKLFMMAGASRLHVRICQNIGAQLWNRLRGHRCQPYQSDLAVRVDSLNEFYPDLVVDCGNARDEAAEPVLVIEVLSASTEKNDRGRKWAAYRRVPSLRHYMLVAQDERMVELYTRSDVGWTLQVFETADAEVTVSALNLSLNVAEVYEGVELTAA